MGGHWSLTCGPEFAAALTISTGEAAPGAEALGVDPVAGVAAGGVPVAGGAACVGAAAAAGVAVTVSSAPDWELSSCTPAVPSGTEIQVRSEPLPQADAGGFPAQWPSRCPDASLTSTAADAGHFPVQVSGTRSDADTTRVPLTPTPDGAENVSVP